MKLRYAIKAASIKKSAALLVITLLSANLIAAQTTAFTYQGKIAESGNPVTGTYQMQFKLFDAVTAGNQIGSTLDNPSVAVNQGIFSVLLNFGANTFSGADRYLEIGVRHNSGESYTTLNPRQQIASSPYSIRTLSAQQADVALDANKLGGVIASEYVTNATLSTDAVRNQTTQQPNVSFNIGGNGLIGGNVGIGTQTPTSKLDVRGNLTFDNGGDPIIYAGTVAAEQNRYLSLINSFALPSASGLKAGGILVADSFGFANPGKNELVVKGSASFGITISPNYRVDSFGAIRSFANVSTQIVSETAGGTNAWARFYMVTPSQRWVIGSSQNFNGNQFYLNDDTLGQTRMAIQPNGGAITFPLGNVGIGTSSPGARLQVDAGNSTGIHANSQGNAVIGLSTGSGFATVYGENTSGSSGYGVYGKGTTGYAIFAEGNAGQSLNKGGFVKAMLFVLANGTISRCYNGLTGATTNGCGFSVVRNNDTSGPSYAVNFGFDVSNRFISLTSSGGANITGRVMGVSSTFAQVLFFEADQTMGTIDSDFYIIVY